MKNHHATIKCVLIITLIIIYQIVLAQITANLNIFPPYSPYYRDYTGYLNNKTVVSLINNNAVSGTPAQVYILGSIRKDDNSITIRLKDSYKPTIPITLVPNMPKTLTGAQLRDIFGNGSASDITFTGITMKDVITNQALPEGNYSVCIQIKDYSSSKLLAEDCRSIFIAYCEPPQLITPMNNSVEIAKRPQYIFVSWLPVTPAVQGVSYRLRMLKLPKGVSPTDAINYSTQVMLDKSNIRTTNYPLDLASGIELDTSSVYVMQVTATSPNAYIKNEGKSEPIQFMYKSIAKPKPDIMTPLNQNANFVFLNPKKLESGKKDTLRVNNENDMLINWCWLKKVTVNPDTVTVADSLIIKEKDLKKYTLHIDKVKTFKNDNSIFAYDTEFIKIDKTGMIGNLVQLSDSQATAAGFIDGNTYRATIKAYNTKNQLVTSLESPDFVYKRIPDELPTYKIPILAAINYSFKTYPEMYPVSNSEVTIEALKLQNSNTQANIVLGNKTNLFKSLPAESVNGKNFVKITSVVVKTDSMGKISTNITVPQKYFDTDSISFRIKLANSYYVDKDFKILNIPVIKKDSFGANFGTLVAKTYAYQLKLNVRKKFTFYDLTRKDNVLTVSLNKDTEGQTASFEGTSGTGLGDVARKTYYVGKDTIAQGIPVVLYRINKQENIPYYEGEINKPKSALKHTSPISIIGLGSTSLEKDSTYVTFNKLLATNKMGEEYHILAIKNLDEFLGYKTIISDGLLGAKNSDKSKNTNTIPKNFIDMTPATSDLLANAIQSLLQGGANTNFVDSGEFIAVDKPIRVDLPVNTKSDDAYYRIIKANYDITSCSPPTSKINGRLLYTWKSDINKTLRPLANTHFSVIVDYVDSKNVSIGSAGYTDAKLAKAVGHSEYTALTIDGTNEVIPIHDQYAVMAEGTTDANGYFIVDVVNMDKKGSLGKGYITHSSSSAKPPVYGQNLKDKLTEIIKGGPQTNPIDKFNAGFGNNQQTLNANMKLSFDAQSQSFEVGKKGSSFGKQMGGGSNMMYAPMEDETHGPSPSNPALMPEEPSTTSSSEEYSRTYRIAIDGDKQDYYYPSKETIVIQAFQSMSTTKTLTHYVKEFKVIAKTFDKTNNKPLNKNIQITLYRKNQKPANLPVGEGDGKYLYTVLVSPEYIEENVNRPKFEQLWPSQQVAQIVNPKKPTDPLTYGLDNLHALLQSEYKNYLLYSSSTVNVGENTYDKTTEPFPDMIDSTTNWADPTIPFVEVSLKLNPLKSRVLAIVREAGSNDPLTTDRSTRVVLSANEAIDKNIKIDNKNSKAVDKYGYAEFLIDELPLNNFYKFQGNDINQKSAYFYAMADGYNFGTQTPTKIALNKSGTQGTPKLVLFPSAQITGQIINADAFSYTPGQSNQNNPLFVDSYLQVDSGKIYESQYQGDFDIPIAPKNGVKIRIIPKDVAWFDTTLVLTQADLNKSLIKLNKIQLYRRKHRIQFSVSTKLPTSNIVQTIRVKNATIQLGDNVITTDQYGKAQFPAFENVSVNNYTFVVKGPNGQGYIPKTVNVNSEETREFKQIDIVLEKGSEISGTVKLDGNLVKNARVYLEVNNTGSNATSINYFNKIDAEIKPYDKSGKQTEINTVNVDAIKNLIESTKSTESNIDDANLVVAYTDANGKYTLQGVPVNNQKINVIATLDTTFTVAGDKQQVNIQAGSAQLNFNLKSYNNALVNKLYGFPLTVEKIEPVNSKQIKVTGLVHWTEAISDFKLNDDNKVLRVENVLFDLSNNSENLAIAKVHDNSVDIPGVTHLKLSYIDKYNVELTSNVSSEQSNTTALKITKENDFGKIGGFMQIVDNSFNYPSSYLDFTGSLFYLGTKKNNVINNTIYVATSAYSETESLKSALQTNTQYKIDIDGKVISYKNLPKPIYWLSNQKGDSIEFKLINFTAKANPKESYIDDKGKIHLNTSLKCHIDNAQPENFSVYLPEIILDENKVYDASYNYPINIKLEDWMLEIRDWRFSTTEGGIISTNGLLKTKIVDIKVDKFVLRNDMFIMKANLRDLSLAGGKFPLKIEVEAKPQLNYEYKVGRDMLPHWNFSLMGTANKKVASLPPLKVLDNYTVDLNYIEILSNNEMIVQLMQKNVKPTLFKNDVAEFELLTIFNGPNYINVSGLLNTSAPRMGNILLSANWSDKDLIPKFDNVKTDFEAKGFVHFEAEDKEITINDQIVKIEGRVLEKPDLTFNPLPATFYARKGKKNYEVILQKDWVTQLTNIESKENPQKTQSTGFKLKIDNGGMNVIGSDWSTLKYNGIMSSNSSSDKVVAPTSVNFEVLGAVSAKSDDMQVSGGTSFGSVDSHFDFKNKELRGSINIVTAVDLGSVRVIKGNIETCFGEGGFYVAGGMSAFIPAGPLSGIYNVGMMAGNYKLTPEIWGIVNSCIDTRVVNNCYFSTTKTLSGFYFAFNREIIDFEESFNFIIANGYVKATALLGGDFYVNYVGNHFKVGADGYIYIYVGAGLSAITGTSISGSIDGQGMVGFQFGPPNYFYASLGLGFNAKVEQNLGVTSLSAEKSVRCLLSASSDSGFKVSLGGDGDKVDCDIKPEKKP